jgi:hypothetical protein
MSRVAGGRAGSPDFSWYNKPKRDKMTIKYYQMAVKISNVHKSISISHSKAIQNIPKYVGFLYQIYHLATLGRGRGWTAGSLAFYLFPHSLPFMDYILVFFTFYKIGQDCSHLRTIKVNISIGMC